MQGIIEQISTYFAKHMDSFLLAVWEHVWISLLSLCVAAIIGIPLGIIGAKYKKQQKWLTGVFQVLRIVPSLAVLVLLIPIMGTGIRPAITALVLLAIPPILMNTMGALEGVPFFMIETAEGLGMTEGQIWQKIKLPLALPMVLAGIKIAIIEIIASTTIAAEIGAGGLGGIILTGLRLNRVDWLLIGGVSVAVLSILMGFSLNLLDKVLLKYKYTGKRKNL